MLESTVPKKNSSKDAYKKQLKILQNKLVELQQKVCQMNIPVIITFEGFSASGKGSLIGKLVYPLDPRTFTVYTMAKVYEDAQLRPFLCGFWTKTPAKGRIAIFDKSWYSIGQSGGLYNLSSREKANFYYDVNAFEKNLLDDGNLIIKFFLHISKEEQRERFKQLERNEETRWRVNEGDWEQNRNYEKKLKEYQQMIRKTDSNCEWTQINAKDKRSATITMYKTIIEKIEVEIKNRQSPAVPSPTELRSYKPTGFLKKINPNCEISSEKYEKELEYYQEKARKLCYKLYEKRRPVILVYEGWDAAGKGGNIKRLTERLDPRGYEVIPVAAPSKEELSHHYLWRFYNKFPKDGHIAIFDRSWYGRVMVERIEGFCTTGEWQRAYSEINDCESHLFHHGVIILKFWLQIDQDEQLKRFNARMENPLKQHKINDEDWRNREKWEQYEEAVEEMLTMTNTKIAPWVIVESNNKKYARIKVLKHVVETLENQLQ